MYYDALIVNVLWIVALFVWVFMLIRMRMNKDNKHAQLVQTVLEKNPDVGNVEELMKKIAPKQKLLKEKLLEKLLWGSTLLAIGTALLGYCAYMSFVADNWAKKGYLLSLAGVILLFFGLAYVIYYFVGKKMLAKEIEAEEKKLTAEAQNS